MASAYSTITSNVNLLLVDTKVITQNAPYIAYVSSVNIPGRIATIRDNTGYLSTPNSIIVSTLSNVLFSDGTSSFSITQPFGYITISARDVNTWNIVNTFAFPQPQGTTNVSTLFVNDAIVATSLRATYVSSTNLFVNSISSINIQASTISANTLYTNLQSTNLAYMNNACDNNLLNYQEAEVSKMDWKTIDECIESIRPYNLEKKQLIININKLLEEYRLYY
jgi:hypothetical protein